MYAFNERPYTCCKKPNPKGKNRLGLIFKRSKNELENRSWKSQTKDRLLFTKRLDFCPMMVHFQKRPYILTLTPEKTGHSRIYDEKL